MIEILFLDVDGTLTDGGLFYSNTNDEAKIFNVKDGLGIAVWLKLGKKIALISGKKSPSAERRAKELGIAEIHLGVEDKKALALEILEKYHLTPDQAACVGDDLNDIGLFDLCKESFAPCDCSKWIYHKVKRILGTSGGKGCVREAIEILLEQEELKEKVIEYFEK